MVIPPQETGPDHCNILKDEVTVKYIEENDPDLEDYGWVHVRVLFFCIKQTCY